VEDVLSYVEYDIKQMRKHFKMTAESAVNEGRISPKERKEIISAFENGLRGYTYYER
jgi:arginine decarboxylase